MPHVNKRFILITAGLLCGIAAPLFYFSNGFSRPILFLWILGLGLTGFGLYKKEPHKLGLNKFDGYAIYLLLLVFLPAYFAFLYSIPYQMNTDEAVIMLFQKQYYNNPDFFGLSTYFGFPSFIFILTGWLANLIGGINLLTVRLVHASMGLLIIVASYFTFRQFWKPLYAFSAAAIIGVNHSLLAISRMAMRDNSALLVEVISLPFLFYGLKRKNYLASFIGGSIAGISFYVYHPARIFIFTWIGFFILLFILRKARFLDLVRQAAVILVGFALVVAPLFAGGLNHEDPGAEKFSRERFLFYPEGRQLQKEWVAADSIEEAVITNIKYGLTAFNNRVNDQGYIYTNIGFGFVDPITGIFVWIGVLAVLVKLFLKKARSEDIWAASGFIFLWLLFSFVINKSPIYTRLFVILPFLAYLVVIGIVFLGMLFVELLKKLRLRDHSYLVNSFLIEIVIIIAFANFAIFGIYAKKGLAEGDSVGSTARYIEKRSHYQSYEFVLVSDRNFMFYNWGDAWQWEDWMGVFAQPTQSIRVLSPYNFYSDLNEENFTVFMNNIVWFNNEQNLRRMFPEMKVHNLTPDGRLMAIEVLNKPKSP
ncbi:MAG TPA: hypothetical protein VD998_04360 [Verrucomicrobiae bacterium]|nr:hypothetical protein [Verrucomicrobiae bacterium]